MCRILACLAALAIALLPLGAAHAGNHWQAPVKATAPEGSHWQFVGEESLGMHWNTVIGTTKSAATRRQDMPTDEWDSAAATPLTFWHLGYAGINAPHPITGTAVAVGDIDSGAECDLPFFDGHVTYGADLAGGDTTGACHDGVGHGTATSGDLFSVAPMARIRMYKVFADTSGSTDDATIARAIVRAVQDGNVVLNLSLGGSGSDANTQAVVKWAARNGVLVFAASGNDGSWDAATYPASYPGAIRVGATDANGTPVYFSNSAPDVRFACPGSDVRSAFPVYETQIDDEYAQGGMQGAMRQWASLSGTSMATPVCAGVATRLLALGVAPQHALDAMAATARLTGQRESEGAGIPNLKQAIAYAAGKGWLGEWSAPTHLRYPKAPQTNQTFSWDHTPNTVSVFANGRIL